MSRKTAAAAPYELRKDRGSWHRRPCLYSLHRKQYRRRFSSFSRKEHLLFHFILYLYCIFFCHLFSQKEISIFIHFHIIIICVSPKNSRRGSQVLLSFGIYYVWLQLAAQDRYSYIGTTTMCICIHNFIYSIYIIICTARCFLVPGIDQRG